MEQIPQSLWLFVLVYMVSFWIVFGSLDWFLVWLGFEINMMSFLCFMFNFSLKEVESSIKYFMVQSMGSGVLILSFYFGGVYMNELSLLILSYKMGGGPFFFWFPKICEGISWVSCGVLMTLQKLLPLVVMFMVVSFIIWLVIMVSMIIGAFGVFSEASVKSMMAYSSIHHVGWLMLCMMLKGGCWYTYFLVYFLMIVWLVYLFSKLGVSKFNKISVSKAKWALVLGMLNMGGLPPMFGFYLKWWVFREMVGISEILFFIMILLSGVMLYGYIRICYYILMGGGQLLVCDQFSQNLWSFKIDSIFILGVVFGPILFFV